MLTADATNCKHYLEGILSKQGHRYIWKLVKKYVDYYWDLEKRFKKYSEKELNRVDKLLNEYQSKLVWDYNTDKDNIKMLLKYKAKKEIYLKLKK